MLHLSAFERSHALVCHPGYTYNSGFPPAQLHLERLGCLISSLIVLTRLGLTFASLVPWQAAIPVGKQCLCWPCMVLSISKPRVWMQHVGWAVIFFPSLAEHLSLAQVQSLRAQLESCRARNESLREAAKLQGDSQVPRGYISQVSRDTGPWGRS